MLSYDELFCMPVLVPFLWSIVSYSCINFLNEKYSELPVVSNDQAFLVIVVPCLISNLFNPCIFFQGNIDH